MIRSRRSERCAGGVNEEQPAFIVRLIADDKLNADNIAINIDANIATDEHIMRRIATINGEANGLQHSKSNGQNGDNIAINIATDEHIMRRIATYIAAVSAAALSAGSVFGWGAFSQWSFVLSICLAIFLAVPTIAWIISKFGLHPAMCTTIVSLDFGWILAIFAYDLPMLIAAGLFLGYSLGGIVVIFPLHIAEIADNKRKRMTSNVFQLSLAIGIAFGYLGGYWKENVLIGICGLFLISYGLAIPSIPSLPESVTTSISISSMLRRGITKEVMKGAGLVILDAIERNKSIHLLRWIHIQRCPYQRTLGSHNKCHRSPCWNMCSFGNCLQMGTSWPAHDI
ncbi:hypothetical protein HA402_004988 [Bradysia odoriphaga]|nr:hypothetical protein HA402_004988 [Bradysia odoriphaga]